MYVCVCIYCMYVYMCVCVWVCIFELQTINSLYDRTFPAEEYDNKDSEDNCKYSSLCRFNDRLVLKPVFHHETDSIILIIYNAELLFYWEMYSMFYVNDEPERKFIYTETINLYCNTSNNRLFKMPYLIRALGSYKGLHICTFHHTLSCELDEIYINYTTLLQKESKQ